jgi:hypothetical protein
MLHLEALVHCRDRVVVWRSWKSSAASGQTYFLCNRGDPEAHRPSCLVGNERHFFHIKCDRCVNIFISTHLLFQMRANIILTTRTFPLHIAELNTRKTESSYSPLLVQIGSICHGGSDVRFHKMTNLFWSVITYRLTL